VFERLKEAHLKLSPKKCHFFKTKVKFLGHIVSDKGVSTDPSKINLPLGRKKQFYLSQPQEFDNILTLNQLLKNILHQIVHLLYH
jgi:hypothetical protein